MSNDYLDELEGSALVSSEAVKWLKQVLIVDHDRAGLEWALWTIMMAELAGDGKVETVREGLRRNLKRVEKWHGQFAPPLGLYILRTLLTWDEGEK